MALVDLVMPKMGESIMEATILKWHKQPGDRVKQDETVLEIATDKVDTEVPSTAEGTIEEILFKVDDVVPIGSVIARIRTTADAAQLISNPLHPSRWIKCAKTKRSLQNQIITNGSAEHPAYQQQAGYASTTTAQTTNHKRHRKSFLFSACSKYCSE